MEREYNKGERFGKLTSSLRKNKGMNDISWYNKNPQLLKDAASYPFGVPSGIRFPIEKVYSPSNYPSGTGSATKGYLNGDQMIPGIMTLGIAPTIGLSTDNTSPINVASLNNYDFLRYKNSGKANYDWPDATLYYIAMDSIYMFWNWMQRLYGLLRVVDAENRYMPRALVECQGVDYDDLAANMANFRGYINQVSAQSSAFCVPTTFTYMVRHSWLMSNVYKDQDTQKAQFYVFVPSWVYKYDEMSSPQGGKLVPVPVCQQITYNDQTGLPNKRLKFSDIRSIMDSLLYAALKSEDIGIISGDVLKAYGSNLFKLDSMAEDYQVLPVHNKEVLMQIENATVVPVDGLNLDTFSITQDPNTNQIKWDPVLSSNDQLGLSKVYLNFHTNEPTYEDVTIASRLTATVVKSGNNFKFSAVGSEFVTGLYIHGNCPEDTTTIPSGYYWFAVGIPASQASSTTSSLKLRSMYISTQKIVNMTVTGINTQKVHANIIAPMLGMIFVTNFDWHPTMRYFYLDESTAAPFPIFGDIDKYTLIDVDNLQNLNLACLLSLLDVPGNR